MHEIRDRRDKHGFSINDAVIDAHAPALGPFGLALYLVLARHANAAGEGQLHLGRLHALFGMAEASALWQERHALEQRALVTWHASDQPDVVRYTLLACPPGVGAEEREP